MRNARRVLAVLLAIVALPPAVHAAPQREDDDALFEQFRNPPAEAKPFVRWWWNGLRVREDEVVRELDVMTEAGIGGFEINPIAQPPGSTRRDDPELEWLSPEWTRLVERTAAEARGRGMVADIIVGSGWPFGAEFLEPAQMTQKLQAASVLVEGPTTFEATEAELIERVPFRHGREWPGAPDPELAYVMVAPDKPQSIAQCREVTGEITDGKLALVLPAGAHRIHIGAIRRGFSSVVHGAPGARGPVLDHYNTSAVDAFLSRMSDALNPVFGGRFGGPVRAVFCDSIELSEANWTNDFEDEFEKRAGYALRPWLPFVADFGDPPPVDDALSEAVGRVRYDMSRVLVELFHERFIHTYHRWCHANGALSRLQAYGSPWLLGMLEGFMEADIPETNNWLYSHDYRKHGFRVWSKYASSAAHLSGKRIVSSEAMTNTRGVFETTLEMIKVADDFNFIMGVNHSVLHGFNYSPPEAGFPGWVRYGAYFSEQNPWWPHFPRWSRYNARLSAVFQATQPVVSVAIMAPRADLWSQHGLTRVPFHTDPWFAHELWESISSCGATADYVSETILQGATFVDGELCYGPARYEALILCGARSIEPATAEALKRFVDAGGRVAFVRTSPERSPGFANASENDRLVRDLMQALRAKGGERVVDVEEPPEGDAFLGWTDAMLGSLSLTRSVELGAPDAEVFQVHRRDGERDLLFFANAGAGRKTLPATFLVPGAPFRWDPETGERRPFPMDGTLVLEPYESLLLAFEKGGRTGGSAESPARVPVDGGMVLDGVWTLSCDPIAGDRFSRELSTLVDLGESTDPELNTFAGTATYETVFDLRDGGSTWLDLGTVHGVSEAKLNGKLLGTRWYGRHAYDVSGVVKTGRNDLEVRVTTVLFNHARTLRSNEAASRWIGGDKAKKTVPAGLVGPVRIIE